MDFLYQLLLRKNPPFVILRHEGSAPEKMIQIPPVVGMTKLIAYKKSLSSTRERFFIRHFTITKVLPGKVVSPRQLMEQYLPQPE